MNNIDVLWNLKGNGAKLGIISYIKNIISTEWIKETSGEYEGYYKLNLNHKLKSENLCVIFYEENRPAIEVFNIVDENNIVIYNENNIRGKVIIFMIGENGEVPSEAQILDTLNSTSIVDGLSANKGKELNDKINVIDSSLETKSNLKDLSYCCLEWDKELNKENIGATLTSMLNENPKLKLLDVYKTPATILISNINDVVIDGGSLLSYFTSTNNTDIGILEFNNCNNLTIKNVKIKGNDKSNTRFGVTIKNSTDIKIEYCDLEMLNLNFEKCNNYKVSKNKFINSQINCYNISSNITIDNNYFNCRSGKNAISVQGLEGAIKNVNINRNTIINCNRIGIECYSYVSDLVVSNNTIDMSLLDGVISNFYFGISISGCVNSIVSNNTIKNSDLQCKGGIEVTKINASSCDEIIVENNNISGFIYGVQLNGICNKIKFLKNTFTNQKTIVFDIQNTGNYIDLINNTIFGGATITKVFSIVGDRLNENSSKYWDISSNKINVNSSNKIEIITNSSLRNSTISNNNIYAQTTDSTDFSFFMNGFPKNSTVSNNVFASNGSVVGVLCYGNRINEGLTLSNNLFHSCKKAFHIQSPTIDGALYLFRNKIINSSQVDVYATTPIIIDVNGSIKTYFQQNTTLNVIVAPNIGDKILNSNPSATNPLYWIYNGSTWVAKDIL